jgi:DNA-binding beta-propeller fold protein YncE
MFRFSHLILPVFAVLLAACSTVEEKAPFDGPLIWPQPPDRPRFAYETMLRSPADVALVTDDLKLREKLTGVQAASDKPVLDKPSSIVARHGTIYVADTGSNTIVVFDIPRRRIFRFGIREPGTLAKPAGLALLEVMLEGTKQVIGIYVADSKLRKVNVYDPYGLYLYSVGSPDDLDRPTGVAVSPDGQRIYVVDRSYNESDQHRVVVYDPKGNKVQVIGTRGKGDGQFNVPLQAAVGPDGTLYVLDSGNFRVQAFDKDGKFLRSFGKPGKEFGNLARPRGIAVDDDGNVYVSDASFNNFQIFNPEGQLLLTIGEGSLESNPGRYGMLSGIAVDETGRVFVVDQLYAKVEVMRRLTESEGQEMLEKAKIKK